MSFSATQVGRLRYHESHQLLGCYSRSPSLLEFVICVMWLPFGFPLAFARVFAQVTTNVISVGTCSLVDLAISNAYMVEYYSPSAFLCFSRVRPSILFPTTADVARLVFRMEDPNSVLKDREQQIFMLNHRRYFIYQRLVGRQSSQLVVRWIWPRHSSSGIKAPLLETCRVFLPGHAISTICSISLENVSRFTKGEWVPSF